jgi:hypothetical protein
LTTTFTSSSFFLNHVDEKKECEIETSNIPLPEPKENENVEMAIDNPSVEAEKQMYLGVEIPTNFSYPKESQATLRRFLHLYNASTKSMTSALYERWMLDIANIRAQQFGKQVRYTYIVSLNREPFPADRIRSILQSYFRK